MRYSYDRRSADVAQEVLEALETLGGGSPLDAIIGALNSTATRRQVQQALQVLQSKGKAFTHDAHGSLGVWGGLPAQSYRYWSTREQVKRRFGYSDDDLGR